MKALLLSGGGVRGIAYIGLLADLDLSECHTFIGISIGAVFSLACALGYTYDTLLAFVHQRYETFTHLAPGRGFHLLDHRPLVNFIRDLLLERGFSPKLTFAQLHTYTGNELHCVVTALDADDPIDAFSFRKTPDVSVTAAVMASASYPLVFPLTKINGRLYLDGALTQDLGLFVLDEIDLPSNQVLAVVLDGSALPLKLPSLGYFGSLIELLVRLLKNRRTTRDDIVPRILKTADWSPTIVPATWEAWEALIKVGRTGDGDDTSS